jgi:hypothetical protein
MLERIENQTERIMRVERKARMTLNWVGDMWLRKQSMCYIKIN